MRPFDFTSTLSRSTNINRKKRDAESFEQDDGFVFKRIRPPNKQSEVLPTPTPPTPDRVTRSSSQRSSPRISKGRSLPSPKPSPPDELRNYTKSRKKAQASALTTDPVSKGKSKADIRPPSNNFSFRKPTDTVVAIPVTETPMIRRNQDFRNAKRRSSLAMRGKRASSIGSKFIAMPHKSISTKEFFRHISAVLPDPLRMKQLLIWCGRRAIDSQLAETKALSRPARLAKQIEESVVSDLLQGNLSTSWYQRLDDSSIADAEERKPHPQNVANLKKLEEYEATLERLRREAEAWKTVVTTFNTFHANVMDTCPPVPEKYNTAPAPAVSTLDTINKDAITLTEDNVDLDSLTEEERAFLQECDEQPDSKDEWLDEIVNGLEVKVDKLFHTLYTADQFERITKDFCEDLFTTILSAQKNKSREQLQPMDLLRALAKSK